MNFDLAEEHKMIPNMSRDFADKVIAPRSEEMERTGEYFYDIMAEMAELGMMGIRFPEEYGGSKYRTRLKSFLCSRALIRLPWMTSPKRRN